MKARSDAAGNERAQRSPADPKAARPSAALGSGRHAKGKDLEHSATFTVDAALLQELGERLIGRSYIALAELVKNAYDADATDCGIQFGEDEIVVWDNGHGISEKEFHEHWTRIGTTHKSSARVSRRFRRPMTGSKGIGRLSVQFLAGEMELESATADNPSQHLRAKVDWAGVQGGENLDTVTVRWAMLPGEIPDGQGPGTRIVLKNLRTRWNAEEIEKLGREIWLLQPPFIMRPDGSLAARTGLDFHVDVDAPEVAGAKEAFNKLQVALFKNWKARIRGRLRRGRRRSAAGAVPLAGSARMGEALHGDGHATVEVTFKAGYPDGLESEKSFRETIELPVASSEASGRERAALDEVKFDILVFKTAGKQPGGVPVAEMREYLRNFGNVSVYDSGFRLPYYGADHDWLNIARDQGRRLVTSELLPARLNVQGKGRYLLDLPAPGRIFGTVEVDTNHERRAAAAAERDATRRRPPEATTSPNAEHVVAERNDAAPGTYLQIQPGRDRLADNAAFTQLRDLVRFSLDFYANRYRFLAAQTLERKRASEAPSKTFRRAVTILDRNEADIPTAVYREVRGEIVAAEKASKVAEEAIDRRAVLLAPLATAGMAALALSHELGREIPLLERSAARLADVADELNSPDLGDLAARLSDGAHRLRGLQEMFSPLASEEDREATARLRVAPVVQTVVRGMEPIMLGIQFKHDGLPADLRFPVGSYADWNAVLQNVLSNAWNATLDSAERIVAFDGGRRGRGREWLRVSDTGVGLGVPIEDAATLFDPFERRLRIRDTNRSIALGGQGLGLAMVRMIARHRAAEAAFVPPRPGYSTSFELSWKGGSK